MNPMKCDQTMNTKEGRDNFQRLNALAAKNKIAPDRAHMKFAQERTLARLFHADPKGQKIAALKGGAMMVLAEKCNPLFSRGTSDIDLNVPEGYTVEQTLDFMREALAQDPFNDGLVFGDFEVQSVRDKEQPFGGGRITAWVQIGACRLRFCADIVIGIKLPAERRFAELPTLFPDRFPPTRVPVVAWESVMADKIVTLIDKGMRNSRLRDYYDMWVLFENDSVTPGSTATSILAKAELINVDVPSSSHDLDALSEEFAQRNASAWDKLAKARFSRPVPSFPDLCRYLREKIDPYVGAAYEMPMTM